ncbi:9343_t:CDS:2 [Funneliformis geosporum]|uniref:16936_t:CDS:1 n=1 Tax=Funneliformis geosporum TaxID=1117311 RepID=A0A9W4T190_9GLOM|nr:16936_t:CDS:2 [Funneliformis geosporum]CAI2189156.1 9343_t:CDS:2 [Funneliformis geosporum]
MTQITKSNNQQQPFVPDYLRDTWIDKHNKTSFSPIHLPSRWNPNECSTNLKIQDGFRLLYTGLGRNIWDTGAVRANCPIPFETGIYYFEMEVIDMGERGNIGLGVGKKSCPLNRMPGWEKDSIGYHGDDGPIGRDYGALYSTGDTAGCGINYLDGTVFFTKNGIHLGIASKYLFDGDLYPTVGLISPNECIEINFGMKPFEFDIDQYAKYAFADAENQRGKIKKDSILSFNLY